jgi:3-oxoacyl-[acyl-carrier protein] reductase
MNFENKVAVVTGGGGGIGEAYVKALSDRGAHVVVVDLDQDSGLAVTESLAQAGRQALFLKTDIAEESECREAVTEVCKRFGGIDLLINNAAIFQGKRKEGLLTIDSAYYRRFMEVNMNGMLWMTRAVAPEMIKRGGGAIVNQSSTAAWSGGDFYSVSKAGINALTVSLSRELGAHNIRVNAIAPGPIDSPATRSTIPADRIDALVSQQPLKRLGEMTDVVGACLFLLSDQASWITGQVLCVDGGSVTRL